MVFLSSGASVDDDIGVIANTTNKKIPKAFLARDRPRMFWKTAVEYLEGTPPLLESGYANLANASLIRRNASRRLSSEAAYDKRR